jgi:hypothetical protein
MQLNMKIKNRFIVQLKDVLLVIATTFSKFLISFEITFFNITVMLLLVNLLLLFN